MPIALFELACLVVVTAALVMMGRRRPIGALLSEYGVLALGGLLGEVSCVAWYRFYAYAPGWHARWFGVPLLIPLIWPLIVLSAREVAAAAFPGAGRLRPLVVGLLVAFDASLIEVVAVRAGLWAWAEPGHLGVPLIGILGWGAFAAGASLVLDRPSGTARLAAVVTAPLVVHLFIQASWWGLFRWTLRGPLGSASIVGVGLVGLAASAIALGRRRAGQVLPLEIAAPRMLASGLFFCLLALTAAGEVALWQHALSVAVPYLILCRIKARGSPAGPAAATAPSPPGTSSAAPFPGG